MTNIGILAYQGSVEEHINSLSRLDDVNVIKVKFPQDLDNIAGLILPGGESTTIGKLIKEYGLIDPLVKKITHGMPVWGTCAGMILLAKEIIGEDYGHLNLMDIAVRRNAYGSQLDSFTCSQSITQICETGIPMVFIRAPWIERLWGDAEILAQVDDKIVAARQKNMLATSFHPELTSCLQFHNYFVQMAREYEKSKA